jgi:hypothetical protein
VEITDHWNDRPLRARRERPRSRRTTKQRDERAPLHSITSSARASSLSGIVTPRAFTDREIDDDIELHRLLHRDVGGFRQPPGAPCVFT